MSIKPQTLWTVCNWENTYKQEILPKTAKKSHLLSTGSEVLLMYNPVKAGRKTLQCSFKLLQLEINLNGI